MPAIPDRLKLLLAALLFSTGGAAIKATEFSGWQVAGLRSGVAFVAVLLLAPEARRTWYRSWRGALVAVAYAVTLTLYVTANKLTTSANTIFLQSTAPLYLLLLGPWLLKEPIRRSDLVIMLAVGAGMVCFFIGREPPIRTAPDPATGNILALLSGICWALTIAGLRWMGSARAAGRDAGSAVGAVALGNLVAFLAALPWAMPFGAGRAADWAVIAYLGVFQIAIAYLFVTAAMRTVPALEASILLLLEPALNPLWAWLVHSERPGPWALAGGAVILIATTLKGWHDARPAPTPVT